jgi:aspartokinase
VHPTIVVQKYGGSSVSSIQGIDRVAERIIATQRQGYAIVAVVSAMGNTTNELLTLAKQVSPTPPKRELDLLVSVGERVSMSLLAMALEKKGAKAKSFTGSQSGIITDTHHGNSKIIEVKPHRIQEALTEGYIVIVAGFQGMSTQREVTTLGRGGSDTTAVALAAALSAECCEICSDVSGVYSTDPRVVPEAVLLSELGLQRAISMARNGAKVLQAEALQWCLNSGITLVANATTQPFGAGTRLMARDNHLEDPPVIAFDRELRWTQNPSQMVLDDLFSSVRYCADRNGNFWLIWDTRNAHGVHEDLGQPIGSITLLGISSELTWRAIHHDSTQWWKQDAQGVTIFVEPTEIDALVQFFHSEI